MRLPSLSAACLAASLLAHAPGGHAGEITLRLSLAEGTPGTFGCALFRGEAGFPMNPEPSLQQWLEPDAEGRAVCTFSNLPAGDYAVSAVNDTNGNQRADTYFLGRPKEAWAVSGGARFRFRALRFDEARVAVTADGTSTLDAVLAL